MASNTSEIPSQIVDSTTTQVVKADTPAPVQGIKFLSLGHPIEQGDGAQKDGIVDSQSTKKEDSDFSHGENGIKFLKMVGRTSTTSSASSLTASETKLSSPPKPDSQVEAHPDATIQGEASETVEPKTSSEVSKAIREAPEGATVNSQPVEVPALTEAPVPASRNDDVDDHSEEKSDVLRNTDQVPVSQDEGFSQIAGTDDLEAVAPTAPQTSPGVPQSQAVHSGTQPETPETQSDSCTIHPKDPEAQRDGTIDGPSGQSDAPMAPVESKDATPTAQVEEVGSKDDSNNEKQSVPEGTQASDREIMEAAFGNPTDEDLAAHSISREQYRNLTDNTITRLTNLGFSAVVPGKESPAPTNSFVAIKKSGDPEADEAAQKAMTLIMQAFGGGSPPQ